MIVKPCYYINVAVSYICLNIFLIDAFVSELLVKWLFWFLMGDVSSNAMGDVSSNANGAF